ncbi:MAG TPA: RNA 2'-phosphotransferase, partial [Aggregatilineales bacterium]|nr:RNA 2'-phosphotransferase [Aggregatilineales bacterium]
MTINLKRLSRTMAHALRHDPQHYHLELDSGGWVDLSVLVAALRENIRAFAALTEHDIKDAVAASAKPRYEIMEGRIRARYGHSTPEKIPQSPATPPDILYHGTNSHALSLILKDGLKAMQRQYVHFAVEA